MNKVITPVGLLAGLIIGGYGFYVGELDGTEPLSAGQVALVHGEYQQAIGHFEQVFEEFRRSAQVPIFAKGVTVEKLQHGFEASLGLAEAYLHLGDTQKAREHLDDAREKNYSPKLAYLAADIAIADEEFDRALAAMEELGKWSGKEPSFVGVYIKRARFHQRRHHCAEAKADYQRVLDSLEDSPMSSAKADLSIDFAWLLATGSEASCRDGQRALALLDPWSPLSIRDTPKSTWPGFTRCWPQPTPRPGISSRPRSGGGRPRPWPDRAPNSMANCNASSTPTM